MAYHPLTSAEAHNLVGLTVTELTALKLLLATGATPAPAAATAFTTALSSSSGTVGNAVTLTVAPTGAAWPSSVVLSPAVTGLSGTFAPTTRTPSGTTAATFDFRPSTAGSGTISVSASPSMTGPAGLTYQATAAAAPTPTSITSATLAADGVALTVVLSQAATITGSAIINVNGSVDTLTWSDAATATATHTGVLATAAHSGDTVNLSVVAGFTTPALASSASVAVTNNSTVATPTPTPAPAPTSDGILAGLPSTIVAGQPLSAATYTPTQATPSYFVLFNVTVGAEEGLRWSSGVMGTSLKLLIPQTAATYTVRGFAAASGGSPVYESAQIAVTAAPGALPATPTQTADTGATPSSVTMNWTATGNSYRFLARTGAGSAYGSLADTTVSTNSYTFTGLAASSTPRAVVIPQNANGYGTPTGQFLSFTTA